MKQYDAITIGSGEGGKTLTAELAKRGWKAAPIKRSVMMYGGTRPNIAHVPTKRPIHEAEEMGWLYPTSYERQAEVYKVAIAWKNEMTAASRADMFDRLSSLPGAIIYTGMASFASKDVVKVALPDEVIGLQGKKIFINTGSTSIIPAIDGLKGNKQVYTSTSLMELNVLPRYLIIVDGGYIGLEFAPMYVSFGSKATVLEEGDKLIAREDCDMINAVKEAFEKKGMEIRLNARAQSIRDTTDGVILIYMDTAGSTSFDIEGDAILAATGRKSTIEGLNLRTAEVEVDSHGTTVVNGYLHIISPNIWAMGDAKGGLQSAHISLDDYRTIRDDPFENKERMADDRNPVVYSVFIDSPLSHVGLTEEEVIRRGYSFKISRPPVSVLPRARTLQQTDDVLRAIIDSHSGRIMGCTLFCAELSEVINIVNMAMRTGQHYTFLRDFIFTHLSVGEGLNELFSID